MGGTRRDDGHNKLYLWDWSAVSDPGARFENLIASHLLKFCHRLEDAEGVRAQLWYLRDRDGREVDFLVTLNRKPWFAVEAKLSVPSKHRLTYFRARLAIPQLFCVTSQPTGTRLRDGVIYASADTFLRSLGV